ncbi:MAG: Proline-tRNA ligase [Parcubacteria group bacterium GW2011_GWA2_45_14]|nr:MAG: Proline-tRNA ligase [Parcubacteria group bacterium GW2011_GWA2_45_14]
MIKTNKEAHEFDSVNATLLQKGGFIERTMAGVYTYLPLGWRVLNKIENIIREEMDKVGTEMLMPALAPRQLWQQTGRQDIDILFMASGANEASIKKNNASYIINPSHEEIITPIAQKIKTSYKDLPFAVYQIQTKFRNEERPKSGLLRGREFRMKDLYSFHATEEDMLDFYEKVKSVYVKIFDRLGIGADTFITQATGGDFTANFSHEFQTICESGEDTVYIDKQAHKAYNKEIVDQEVDKANFCASRTCEVGNIFPLGTKYSEAVGYTYTDQQGKQQPVVMASYGIGSSRVMGVLVEKFNDENGIIWPAQVAPFQIHGVVLNMDNKGTVTQGERVLQQLEENEIEVLWDDRSGVSAGKKLAEADLIGIPWRVVVSKKTGEQVEVKQRKATETKLINLEELVGQVNK